MVNRKIESFTQERLQAFLYILMRDHLPTGAISETIETVIDNDYAHPLNEFDFSNPHLAALAEDYAQRIREG